MIPLVAASERGPAQTKNLRVFGVAGQQYPFTKVSRIELESSAKEGNSPVDENWSEVAGTRVPRDTSNPVGSWGAHPPRLNTT